MDQPVAANRPMNSLEWAMLLALSVLWGGSFFFTGIAVKELPPFTIVVLRVGVAAVILNIVVRAMGLAMPRQGHVWAAFFGMGFLNNAVPFTLFVWGQTHIASGLASILNATTPLFTVIVAHLFTTDERLTANRLAGVLIGLVGVAVMIGRQAFTGLGPEALGTDTLAELACLGAALSYGFAGVYGRRFKRIGVAPMLTATGQVTASAVMLAPVALFAEHPWTLPTPSLSVILAILGIAALSTALAYVLYFRILATAGATNLVLVTFLIPVSALILGTFVLHEKLVGAQLLGMAMIGLGLAAIDGRLPRLLREAVRPGPAPALPPIEHGTAGVPPALETERPRRV
jgi:drug/metabolite transporter (DMT)-like permease